MIVEAETVISLRDVNIPDANVRLDSISFKVTGTSCFALLGLPKSGKTTLIKTLAGLIRPVSGMGRILDYSLGDPKIMRDPRIGFLHQATNWPGKLTINEVIHMVSLRHPDSPFLGDIDTLLAHAGLKERRALPVNQLTPGERQCVGLIAMHLRNPQMIILDDPVVSAERQAALDLIDHIGTGRTVFFTSSHLSDVQQIADHVAVLHRGSVIAQDTTSSLFSLPDTAVFRVLLHGDTQIVFDQLSNLAWISHMVEQIKSSHKEWTIWLRDEGDTPSHLLRAILSDHRLKVIEFNQIRPRVDYFLTELQQAVADQ